MSEGRLCCLFVFTRYLIIITAIAITTQSDSRRAALCQLGEGRRGKERDIEVKKEKGESKARHTPTYLSIHLDYHE